LESNECFGVQNSGGTRQTVPDKASHWACHCSVLCPGTERT
jgi:hypothetical protein